jgi:hypothetical protein
VADIKHEYFDPSGSAWTPGIGVNYTDWCQTFVANSNHGVDYFKLHLLRNATSVGTLHYGLYTFSGGAPQTALATGSVDVATTLTTDLTWVKLPPDSQAQVTNGVTYAIVLWGYDIPNDAAYWRRVWQTCTEALKREPSGSDPWVSQGTAWGNH